MSSDSAPSVKTLEESLRRLALSTTTSTDAAESSATEQSAPAPIGKFTISSILNDSDADPEDYAAASMVLMTCIHEAWNSKGPSSGNDIASDVHYYFTVLKRWPDGLEGEHVAACILSGTTSSTRSPTQNSSPR